MSDWMCKLLQVGYINGQSKGCWIALFLLVVKFISLPNCTILGIMSKHKCSGVAGIQYNGANELAIYHCPLVVYKFNVLTSVRYL